MRWCSRLFGIANHDNMGGIFRNAAAFGADAVLIDAGCCDPLYRKAIRVSVGGVLTVPFARLGADEDVVSLLATHGFSACALSPSGSERLGHLKRGSPRRLSSWARRARACRRRSSPASAASRSPWPAASTP